MLRTTISRLKKVCTVAFLPRLLRGDQRYAPGKLEIFSYAVLKKAQKSTKSTDDDDPESKKVTHKDDHEYLFVPEKEPKLPEKNVNETETTENLKESFTPIVPPPVLKESQGDKCQRIIDQAFGKEDIEPILGEQYYSSAAINIDETRRAITKAELAKLQYIGDGAKNKPVTDQRIQFGVFKSRDINKDDAPTEPEELIMNDPLLRATAITKAEKLPRQPVDDLSFLKESLRVLPAEEGNSDLSERLQEAHSEGKKQKKLPPPDCINIIRSGSLAKEINFGAKDSDPDNVVPLKAYAKQDINVYITNQEDIEKKEDVKDQPVAEKPASESGSKLGNEAQVQASSAKGAKVLANTSPQVVNPQVYDLLAFKTCPAVRVGNEELGNEDLTWKGLQFNDNTVNSTTAKETEEELTQKLEDIEELPLVEATNPKLEGFNVTPKVLGDMEGAIKNFTDRNRGTPEGSTGIDIPGANYDEVAKRCLDTPPSQIDEILLKEMEKLGIPITGSRDPGIRSPVIENDLVQMDVLKKPRRPVEKKDLDLESREYERGAVDLFKTGDEELQYPLRYMCKESALPDHDEETHLQLIQLIKEEQGINDDVFEDARSDFKNDILPNQVLIDPYDKKTIAYDTGEYDPNDWYDPNRRFSYLYEPAYKNTPEPQIEATVPTKSSALDNTKEEMTQNTPTMSPDNNAWFNEYTQRYVDGSGRKFTLDDGGMSERELIQRTMEAAKAQDANKNLSSYYNYMNADDVMSERELIQRAMEAAKEQEEAAKHLSSNYNYTNMNQNVFWQNPYPQGNGQKSYKGQSHYDYANMNQSGGVWHNRMPYYHTPQNYQKGSDNRFSYDYSKNPYMHNENAFSKAQEARNAEFAYMYSAKNAAKSEPQATPLQTTQSVPIPEIQSESTATPYYDFSDMNTSENVVNMKQTTESDTVSPQTNKNISAKIDDIKQTPNTMKFQSIPLPPPTFKIYSNTSRSQSKTQYRSRAKTLKPNPLPAREKQPDMHLRTPELVNSFLQAERTFAKKIENAVSSDKGSASDDWRKIPLDTPPALMTYEHILYAKSEKVDRLIPETRTSEARFSRGQDCKINTNTNVSDDIWDTDELDPQSTMKLAQTAYAKVIEDNMADTMNILERAVPPKKGTPEDLWDTEQLDPKHVLTCNETCPIALRPPSISGCESNRLQAIFDGDYAKADLLNYAPEPEPELDSPEGCGSTASSPKMTKVSNLMQADSVLNPMAKEQQTVKATAAIPQSIPSAVPTPSHSNPPTPGAVPRPARPRLPDLNEDVSLSELLRRVRQRNRMLEQHELKNFSKVDMQTVAKCPRKAPRCPPTAPRSPPSNPVPPPSFGLPPLKPRPRSCPPIKKKPRSNKFSTCDLNLTSGLCLNPATIACPEMVCEMNDVSTFDVAHSVLAAYSTTISRCFSKTEWTKPKFDVNKPYSNTRKDGDSISNQNSDKKVISTPNEDKQIIKNTRSVYKACQYLKSPISFYTKEDFRATIAHFTVERLLSPPLAAVSYVMVRYYGKYDPMNKDKFWRPKARIPVGPDWKTKVQDPKDLKQMERELKYLLLSVSDSNSNTNKQNPKMMARADK